MQIPFVACRSPFLFLTLDTLFCRLFADFLFYAAFQVFSLWAAPRTRDKFMFVNSGWGSKPLSHLLSLYPSGHICTEVGPRCTRLAPSHAHNPPGMRATCSDDVGMPKGACGAGRRGACPRQAHGGSCRWQGLGHEATRQADKERLDDDVAMPPPAVPLLLC